MASLSDILNGLPELRSVPASAVQEAREASSDHLIYVVLDDDPTGTQSVADLPVLTAWSQADFAWAFATGKPAVYVMTNSRSLSPHDAETVNSDVVRAAMAAAHEAGVRVSFVSRSDSTLRGHFPLEPQTIAREVLSQSGKPVDGFIIVPAFGDAGRITVRGTHYAGSEATGYVPVAETEFAQDATFGYQSSYLPQWVEEKTHGAVKAAEVLVLDLAILRTDHEGAVKLLRQAHDCQPVVVDIVAEDDLRLLALALIEAEEAGSQFVYRVGPPFVRARIGQEIHPALSEADVAAARSDREYAAGGLIVVGSHVDLTTRQLSELERAEELQRVEISVQKLLDSDAEEIDAYVSALADSVLAGLDSGNVVLATSRVVITGKDADESLAISRSVSAAVVAVVRRVIAAKAPRFVIAKGGITSSDTASKGLGIRHARVVGPMLPGIISLWVAEDGPAQGIPYIVFAGNVGDETSLVQVVHKLS
ncbi:MAG: hypothetical protein MR006_00620 [Arcanobacterium sp.]|nr:hypothetical protein [Arcanobacterium sp.]